MGSAHDAETVKVIVRCRPLNEKEVSENYERYLILMSDQFIKSLL